SPNAMRAVRRARSPAPPNPLPPPAPNLLPGPPPHPPRLDPAGRLVEAPVTAAACRLPEIVRDLDSAGVLLDDLAIRHPSLDDVFLTLTGRTSNDTPKEGDES